MKQILLIIILYATLTPGPAFASNRVTQAELFPADKFAASSKAWNKKPMDYMIKSPEVWSKTTFKIDTSTLAFTKPFNTWPIANPYNYDELKGSDCGNKIIRGFEVNTSTVYFTLGRSPEMCSNPPAMRWDDRSGQSRELVLTPASNWNVASFWQVGNYVIFGLEAQYELGSGAEALGIWNIEDGKFDILSADKLNLRKELGDWKRAPLAATETDVILKSPRTEIAFHTKIKRISIFRKAPPTVRPANSNK